MSRIRTDRKPFNPERDIVYLLMPNPHFHVIARMAEPDSPEKGIELLGGNGNGAGRAALPPTLE